MHDPRECAKLLVAPGKGILAADESASTADKRLSSQGIEANEEMRRQYRELFLGTPGIEEYLGGVILFEETLSQNADDGTPLVKLLQNRHIIAGIKVDQGTEPIPESPDELITKGLIGLPERVAEFRKTYHTGFTKWRSVIKIEGDTLPTASCIAENAKRLATYARNVQDAGMVPIVEPEVLLDGTHSRLRAKAVIEDTLGALFTALSDQAIDLPSLILKTSMALSGNKSGRTDTPEEVAEDTVSALIATVPSDVAGIVFLSGGQTTEQATDNLRAIANAGKEKGAPWPLSFSYARALQEEGLSLWKGKPEHVSAAREAFLSRLKKVSKATFGK
jgi:fructose-bisphosphate aldolase class I